MEEALIKRILPHNIEAEQYEQTRNQEFSSIILLSDG